MKQPPGIAEFRESLTQLEAQIAASNSAGEHVPDEARQMAIKLRELIDALSDLTSSLDLASTDDPPA